MKNESAVQRSFGRYVSSHFGSRFCPDTDGSAGGEMRMETMIYEVLDDKTLNTTHSLCKLS